MTVPRSIDYQYVRPPDRLDIYHGTLLHESEEHLILTHVVHPSRPVFNRDQEILTDGSPIVWFLFKDKPYDVGRFYLPDGIWTGYYVDITEPIHWDGADAGTLESVVDLFLDVWITPDGDHDILDQDELEEAAALGYVTPTQVRAAHAALRTVVSQIASGTFPPEVAVRWNPSHNDIFNATVNP